MRTARLEYCRRARELQARWPGTKGKSGAVLRTRSSELSKTVRALVSDHLPARLRRSSYRLADYNSAFDSGRRDRSAVPKYEGTTASSSQSNRKRALPGQTG